MARLSASNVLDACVFFLTAPDFSLQSLDVLKHVCRPHARVAVGEGMLPTCPTCMPPPHLQVVARKRTTEAWEEYAAVMDKVGGVGRCEGALGLSLAACLPLPIARLHTAMLHAAVWPQVARLLLAKVADMGLLVPPGQLSPGTTGGPCLSWFLYLHYVAPAMTCLKCCASLCLRGRATPQRCPSSWAMKAL